MNNKKGFIKRIIAWFNEDVECLRPIVNWRNKNAPWIKPLDEDDEINPATGLPMIGGRGGVDTEGNLYGVRRDD